MARGAGKITRGGGASETGKARVRPLGGGPGARKKARTCRPRRARWRWCAPPPRIVCFPEIPVVQERKKKEEKKEEIERIAATALVVMGAGRWTPSGGGAAGRPRRRGRAGRHLAAASRLRFPAPRHSVGGCTRRLGAPPPARARAAAHPSGRKARAWGDGEKETRRGWGGCPPCWSWTGWWRPPPRLYTPVATPPAAVLPSPSQRRAPPLGGGRSRILPPRPPGRGKGLCLCGGVRLPQTGRGRRRAPPARGPPSWPAPRRGRGGAAG